MWPSTSFQIATFIIVAALVILNLHTHQCGHSHYILNAAVIIVTSLVILNCRFYYCGHPRHFRVPPFSFWPSTSFKIAAFNIVVTRVILKFQPHQYVHLHHLIFLTKDYQTLKERFKH
ncbi:hypothetical protein CEXT_203361 [Caerostris extrusa]|uniref:Uncharacterized protein n=1 Tax=Caerostris extrusa TaxID=172846 RepID=A0AAV4R3X4_CAEEX|nr:hypothetical protein CEXT_203361 [Caerostris extrusa]